MSLFHDSLLSMHEIGPSEQARGWARNQQQEWIPADGLPRPSGLKNDHSTKLSVQQCKRKNPPILMILTMRPSPDPKSTRPPFRPLSSVITLSTWALLAGMYGTWKICERASANFLCCNYFPPRVTKCYKDLYLTCNFNGTFLKPGWRIPTHIAYTASPVPAAIWARSHPPSCLVLSSAKTWSGVSSSIFRRNV